MSVWDSIPSDKKKSLKQWYTISLSTLLLTFVVIFFMTYIKKPEIIYEESTQAQPAYHTFLSQVASYLPPDVRIDRITVSTHKEIMTIEGTAQKEKTCSQFLTTIQEHIPQSYIHTLGKSRGLYTFKIRVPLSHI